MDYIEKDTELDTIPFMNVQELEWASESFYLDELDIYPRSDYYFRKLMDLNEDALGVLILFNDAPIMIAERDLEFVFSNHPLVSFSGIKDFIYRMENESRDFDLMSALVRKSEYRKKAFLIKKYRDGTLTVNVQESEESNYISEMTFSDVSRMLTYEIPRDDIKGIRMYSELTTSVRNSYGKEAEEKFAKVLLNLFMVAAREKGIRMDKSQAKALLDNPTITKSVRSYLSNGLKFKQSEMPKIFGIVFQKIIERL